jgi:predicted nuclease with TOPRIM domain
MVDDRGESDPLEAMTSKIDFKMNLLNDVMADYREIKQVISGVMKEKESLQQEKERLQQEKERLQQEEERLLHEHLGQFCMHVEIYFKK